MGQTRRAHQKSKTGCAECKRRRIKCSEEKPRCSHCVRQDKSCVYLRLKATHTSPLPSPQPLESGPDTTAIDWLNVISAIPKTDEHQPSLSFELKDLALLHHWSLVTSVSILRKRKLDYYWQTLLPQIAFRHDHVMHNILSISALHMAYLDPSKANTCLLEATQHHSKALEGFEKQFGCIGPENSDAMFANAVLTFFYAFLTFGKVYDDDSTNAAIRKTRILGSEWIPLLRGIEAVLHPVYDFVTVGPLKSMLSAGNWDEFDPDAYYDSYDEQILRIREISIGGDSKVYNEALDLLRKCRMWISQFKHLKIDDEPEWAYNREFSGPFFWIVSAPKKYFELLEQRQPVALVIFAWFGATLHSLNGYWWMEGCGRSIVRVVSECLGPYWSPWTESPRQIVSKDGHSE
ncbi:hypothetical protein PMIN06_000844 [Paraphaeosphaeria minitans]|uniref:Sterol uptake control protein 2 n=1 Tax=Paraphaeosphaeria minitans TaxID=565426 RepID=A0A9P6KQG1_9PLEO|nr:sterol uptake control protein 2 [Paraphaeosphaeria minitans]